MKKKNSIAIFVLSLLLLFPAMSFAQSNRNNQTTINGQTSGSDRVAREKMSDEIRLSRQNKSTRSTSDVIVEAFSDGKYELEVMVSGFNGTAVVQIISGRASSQGYIDVYDVGYEVFGIGNLRAGNYTLRVTAGDDVFEGVFEKVNVGR